MQGTSLASEVWRITRDKDYWVISLKCSGEILAEVAALGTDEVSVAGKDVTCYCGKDCLWNKNLKVENEPDQKGSQEAAAS